MRLLTLDDQPVDLIKVQQRLLGNYSHLQIDMCGIIDRLVPSELLSSLLSNPHIPQESECDATQADAQALCFLGFVCCK